MRPARANPVVIAMAVVCSSVCSSAQETMPVAEPVAITSAPSAVTLYQGRAMVTRLADAPARTGLFELNFGNLPASVDPASLQASVTSRDGGAKLLDVRYDESVLTTDASNNSALRQAIAELDAAMRVSEAIALRAKRLSDQNALLDAIAAKLATGTARDFGATATDPTALAAQVTYIGSARNDLITERLTLDEETRKNTESLAALQAKVNALGGQSKVLRSAIVSVGKASNADATVALRYLVRDATWGPSYMVRADMDAATLAVTYNAIIAQATGENWTDVALTLSTAQPTQRAAPFEVAPIQVDIYVPLPASAMPAVSAAPPAPAFDAAPARRGRKSEGGSDSLTGSGGADAAEMDLGLQKLFSDAAPVQSGTVAAFPIGHSVTIPSDGKATRTQLIATIDLKGAFTYVAQPVADSSVFLRATAANTSPYQLLSGPARVFLGSDSVGQTRLTDLAPGAEMIFWLGTDRRIEAKRTLVKKETIEKGLFEKDDVTERQYRIDISSTLAKPASIEVFDRVVVSRNEKLRVELKDVSPALATDARYLKERRPAGILKWALTLPAQGNPGTPSQQSINWTVLLAKPKDTTDTGVPD